jgi:hypothetical protein
MRVPAMTSEPDRLQLFQVYIRERSGRLRSVTTPNVYRAASEAANQWGAVVACLPVPAISVVRHPRWPRPASLSIANPLVSQE